MGDNTAPNTSKKQKKDSEVPPNDAKHSKFCNHFLFKASLLVIFLVVLPLFSSEAPDFINQTLQTRIWEVLQLIFVGIAVSYGLFSKKSDETDKEHSNAQSYVSGLLQVSSVFDDEADSHDENKVQTWNNQYHRGNNPVVLVAKENHGHNEQRAINSRIGEKPLLLPIRSLKSRVLDDNVEESNEKSGSSNKSRNGDFEVSNPKKLVDNIEENFVRPSPIPWISRSARNMEMEEDGENNHFHYSISNSKKDPEFKKIEPFSLRSQSFRSPRTNNNSTSTSPRTLSPSQSFSSSRKLSPPLSYSSESQSKIVEDVVRKKSFRKSTPPPPPPPLPPPPPHFFYKNSPLMKSSSSVTKDNVISSEKELRRSIRSVPMESTRAEKFQTPRKAYSGTELRPFIGSTRGNEYGEEFISPEDEETFVKNRGSTDKMMHESYNFASNPRFMEFPNEEKKQYVEKFIVESDQEDSETESEDDCFEENSEKKEFATQSDEGPDVDKKADEFIAKFREQIRLQRIESIRRSAGQPARNLVR